MGSVGLLRTTKQSFSKTNFRYLSSLYSQKVYPNNACKQVNMFYKPSARNVLPKQLRTQGRCFSGTVDRNVDVTYEDLEALMRSKDIQLIDVREPKELVEFGKIPGAVNIPLSHLEEALLMADDLFSERYKHDKPQLYDRNIVFYGRGEIKARAALEISRRIGYKKDFKTQYGIKKPQIEDENIVFHCMVGGRSFTAVQLAEKIGYSKARHYKGGWEEYAKKTGQTSKQKK